MNIFDDRYKKLSLKKLNEQEKNNRNNKKLEKNFE